MKDLFALKLYDIKPHGKGKFKFQEIADIAQGYQLSPSFFPVSIGQMSGNDFDFPVFSEILTPRCLSLHSSEFSLRIPLLGYGICHRLIDSKEE